MKATERPETTLRQFGPGSVTHAPGEKGAPAHNTVEGDTTIYHAAVAPRASIFATSFSISAAHRLDGARTHSHLQMEVPLRAKDRAQPYHQVENDSAHALPAMLREIADQLEAQLAATEKEWQAQAGPEE